MKKTVYQVILKAEDGEYVIDEFNSFESANNHMDSISENYGEGQTLMIRKKTCEF